MPSQGVPAVPDPTTFAPVTIPAGGGIGEIHTCSWPAKSMSPTENTTLSRVWLNESVKHAKLVVFEAPWPIVTPLLLVPPVWPRMVNDTGVPVALL